MKKFHVVLLPLLVLFTVCACENDSIGDDGNDDPNAGAIVSNDEYYIQYSASVNYPYILGAIHYATENGEGSVKDCRSRSWTETIGPVKKGFTAWLKVGNDKATCKIQVSKNNSAFATKATGTQSVSFTINY